MATRNYKKEYASYHSKSAQKKIERGETKHAVLLWQRVK